MYLYAAVLCSSSDFLLIKKNLECKQDFFQHIQRPETHHFYHSIHTKFTSCHLYHILCQSSKNNVEIKYLTMRSNIRIKLKTGMDDDAAHFCVSRWNTHSHKCLTEIRLNGIVCREIYLATLIDKRIAKCFHKMKSINKLNDDSLNMYAFNTIHFS